MKIDLSNEMIQSDLAGYRERLLSAETELAGLPSGHIPYQQHKAREAQRKEYLSDIEHLNRLIGYAKEGLEN